MERQSAYCPECDDYMEVYYVKGKWKCENCGKDLTETVDRNIKRNKNRNKNM